MHSDLATYFEAIRVKDLKQVAFGWRTVELYGPEALDRGQVGYGVDAAGTSLVDETHGGWRGSWLVIGHEDESGDPLFLDLADPHRPVYTAAHGAGAWEAELVADTLDGFLEALGALRSVGQGRSNPAELAVNPLSNSGRAEVLGAIRRANPEASDKFWATWLAS